MYYGPRFAPEKPGMPVLGYFAGVGAVLIGLLFVADAYMPRKEHLSFVSNVEGLPAAYKGKPARLPPARADIAPAVAETTGSSSRSSGSAVATEAPTTLPAVAASQSVAQAAKPHKRKMEVRRQPSVGSGQHDFGAPPPMAHKAAKPVERKMVARRQPHREDPVGFGQHDFALQHYGRQDFGFRSREPFGSREPSWRDSWASGSFQGEPRARRNAWSSGNGFGYFR
jgi:hypothetical protein